jgi:hypothetical protein
MSTRHLYLNGFHLLEGLESVELRSVITKSQHWRAALFTRRLTNPIAAWYADERNAGGELRDCQFQSGYIVGGVPIRLEIDGEAAIFKTTGQFWRDLGDNEPISGLLYPAFLPSLAGFVCDAPKDYYGTGALHEFSIKVWLGAKIYIDASKKATSADRARALLDRVWRRWPNAAGRDPRRVLSPQ